MPYYVAVKFSDKISFCLKREDKESDMKNKNKITIERENYQQVLVYTQILTQVVCMLLMYVCMHEDFIKKNVFQLLSLFLKIEKVDVDVN